MGVILVTVAAIIIIAMLVLYIDRQNNYISGLKIEMNELYTKISNIEQEGNFQPQRCIDQDFLIGLFHMSYQGVTSGRYDQKQAEYQLEVLHSTNVSEELWSQRLIEDYTVLVEQTYKCSIER